jgi:hypothetical protein
MVCLENDINGALPLLISSNTSTGVAMWNVVRPQIISQLTVQ